MYFDWDEPKEPGPVAPYPDTVRSVAKITSPDESGRWPKIRDDVEDFGKTEDMMVDYLDAKRIWDRIYGKVSQMSDESLTVLGAWFAANKKDRHRIVGEQLLLSACKEYVGLS